MTNKSTTTKQKPAAPAPPTASLKLSAMVDEQLQTMQRYLNEQAIQLDRIEQAIAHLNQKLERLSEMSGY